VGSGGADEGRILHGATFDFDDRTIPYGVSYWARLVERLLPCG
jgi:hippurate hydrolase